MSMIDWLMLVAIALGHFCLAVQAVNVLHGVGIPEGNPTRLVKVLAIAFLGSVSVGMTWLVLDRPWSGWPGVARGYAGLCILIGAVGLPVATISRRFRRLPIGVSGRSTLVDLTDSIPKEELIGTSWDSFWLRVPGNQAFRLELTDWSIERPRLPVPLDGLRILHLTDLHLTPAYADRFFEAMLEQAEGFEADLVAFTGDLIDDGAMLDRVAPLLSRFRGRLGQFAVLGNHDYRTAPAGSAEALRSAGYTIVEGGWTVVEADGARLAVGGTSAPWGPLPDPADTPEADLRILLSHAPDTLGWAARRGVDLMLSGHTHGGQYRLPVVGPVILPSRYGRRFDCGFFQLGPTLLYVSRGIGAQHPIRVNCAPEIARLTLRSPARPAVPSAHVAERRTIASAG
jgi:predicted MPP superfamily phosphohydrolase